MQHALYHLGAQVLSKDLRLVTDAGVAERGIQRRDDFMDKSSRSHAGQQPREFTAQPQSAVGRSRVRRRCVMGADEIDAPARAVHARRRLRRAQWLVGGRLSQRLQRVA